MEEVRAMPEIPLPDLMAYFDAVRAVTRQYLEQATDADLSREYPARAGGWSRGAGSWGTSWSRRVNTRDRWPYCGV